jgi:heme exporter protein C
VTRRFDPLAVSAMTLMAAGFAAAMTAPPDQLQGELQRLMYVHVPAAWLAMSSFFVTLAASIGWLWRGEYRYDRLAASTAEVGVFFTGLAILLGAVWGKPVWGVWWTWDPRLVTTALLFFIYLGYLALRRVTFDRSLRARRAAIFGVVSFVQVPIVHFSVLWWRSLHQPPTVLRPDHPSIDHTMLAALLVNLLGFTLLGLLLVRMRMRLASAQDHLEEALLTEDQELAGHAIEPPQLKGRNTSV